MSELDIEFLYIGWCVGLKKGVKSDKVWTAFRVGNAYYACWGARDKAIRFKKHDSEDSLMSVKRTKEKDYTEVDTFRLFSIFPYYKQDVEKHLSFNIMANKVM